jgi:hypothetical protein
MKKILHEPPSVASEGLKMIHTNHLFPKFVIYPTHPMEKQSFFARFHDPIIVGAFCIIVPVVFSLGYFYGLEQTDRMSVITKQRNQEMHDSLEIYRQKFISLEHTYSIPQNPTFYVEPSKSN